MRWTSLLLFACSLVLGCTLRTQAQGKITSLYTDLGASKCKTIRLDKETGASVQSCPAIAGYKLLVLDDDARHSVTVVIPGGKKYDLDFWRVVTHAFSSVGNRAEWRVVRRNRKISPVALIVRVNANEDSGSPNHVTSYLVVAKITPKQVCVTHKIPPGAQANEDARAAADSAPAAPCLNE